MRQRQNTVRGLSDLYSQSQARLAAQLPDLGDLAQWGVVVSEKLGLLPRFQGKFSCRVSARNASASRKPTPTKAQAHRCSSHSRARERPRLSYCAGLVALPRYKGLGGQGTSACHCLSLIYLRQLNPIASFVQPATLA